MQLDSQVQKLEGRISELVCASFVLLIAGSLFGLIFNRERTLSYSIGYNLYAAERILAGEVPYRDFHTLYPPATLYLNAALFSLMGTGLYTALFGVYVFKSLTTLALYLCARRVMPRTQALLVSLASLLWLRPNGPFKAVPMHYGYLFLALALYMLLGCQANSRSARPLAIGIALGVLALFKHNIGIYALVGSLALVVLEDRMSQCGQRRALLLLAGFFLPIIFVLAYMHSEGALLAMAKALLFGPGEFLVSRLAYLPSPAAPALLVILLVGCAFLANCFESDRRLSIAIWVAALISTSLFILTADQALIDELIFYAPIMIIIAGLAVCIFSQSDRRVCMVLLISAVAAFMESFPRFAREQSIGAMPFVILLLFYLLFRFRPAIEKLIGGKLEANLASQVLPLGFLLIGSRLLFATYLDSTLHFKSTALLSIERGRGVYFPPATASEIDELVSYIEQRVPEGGYFFAQSYAGSAFFFLAKRRNPSGAQFWSGVGVSPAERARTLEAIRDKGVRLIVTSQKDLAAEKYEPMRNYIADNFKLTKQVGEVLILEAKD
jgi:hypothetical protein